MLDTRKEQGGSRVEPARQRVAGEEVGDCVPSRPSISIAVGDHEIK